MSTTEKAEPSAIDWNKLSEREQAAYRKFFAYITAHPSPRVLVSADAPTKIVIDHSNPAVGQMLLMEDLGTLDFEFFDGLLAQLANASSVAGKIDQQEINFMLAAIKGITPRDQVETMLAAQMAAVHKAMMSFAERLADANGIVQQDIAERAFNKLGRTYAAQMDALKRYRTGGEQKTTVQHVSVSEGGQAIVGNVTQNQQKMPTSIAPAQVGMRQSKTRPMPARVDRRLKLVRKQRAR
jgi:hypothetical protein